MVWSPRLNSAGMDRNTFYSQRSWFNPFWTNGTNGGNCTWYAWGRTFEAQPNNRPTLSYGDAWMWWNGSTGYTKGSTPKVGSVIVYPQHEYMPIGHVAVVEVIHENGDITISESDWGWTTKYFGTKLLRKSQNYAYYPSGACPPYGFLYCYDEPEPPKPDIDITITNFDYEIHRNNMVDFKMSATCVDGNMWELILEIEKDGSMYYTSPDLIASTTSFNVIHRPDFKFKHGVYTVKFRVKGTGLNDKDKTVYSNTISFTIIKKDIDLIPLMSVGILGNSFKGGQ